LLLVPYAGYFARELSSTVEPVLLENRSQNFQWAQTLPLQKTISGLPSFSFLAATVWGLGLMAIAIIQPTPHQSLGLIVHLKPDPGNNQSDVAPQQLLIRIVYLGPTRAPTLCLNEETQSWATIDGALKEEMSRRRPGAEVYLQPDAEIDWESSARMIGRISRFHARVILLTPTDTRFRHETNSWPCL
jgi:hypothetical protein